MQNADFSPESIRKTAFFTGHRHLDKTELPYIKERIFHCVSDAYTDGYRTFYCGCALGFDTVAAFQVIRLRNQYPDIRLSLAIPCESQADRWNIADQMIYHRLLELADDKVILSKHYYQGAMLTRNRYMADRSSLCICWLRNMRGGTASTVRYALLHDRIRIINLAVPEDSSTDLLREASWNCTFIFHSANKNAATVPLHLSPARKLTFRDI